MTHPWTKLIAPWLVVAGLAGAATGQPATGSGAASPAAPAATEPPGFGGCAEASPRALAVIEQQAADHQREERRQ